MAQLHICPGAYEKDVIDGKDWFRCGDDGVKVDASMQSEFVPYEAGGTVIVQYHPWLTKGPAYFSLSRQEKHKIIHQKILEDDEIGPLNGVGFTTIALNTVFDDEGDEINCRDKTTHAQGSVGKVEWVDFGGHSYTGMFKGGDTGFIRFSDLDVANAGNPTDLPWMWPSIAVKLLRDGMDSANAFSQINSNLGQMSYNWFENPLFSIVNVSNEIGSATLRFFKDLMLDQITNFTSAAGHSEFANFDQYGNEEEQPEFPYQLRYTAPRDLNMPSQTYDETYFEFLKRVPVDSVLYVVAAQAYPEAEWTDIGALVLRSELVTSLWGDKKMAFKHTRFDDDLMYHPEWIGSGGNPITWDGFDPATATVDDLRP